MAAPVAAGASLTHAAPAVPDQPHTVTLALPADFFSVLRREAAKLGLGRKARAADLVATLKGQNYEITPGGPQTVHLAPGKAPSFTWAVKPQKGATGQLSASVEAILNGQGAPARLSLGQIDHRFTDLADQAAVQASGAAAALHVFDIPNVGTINLPGLGDAPSGLIVAGLIVLFLVILIIAMIRAAAERRRQNELARRRRRAAAQNRAAEEARDETRAEAEARTLEKV
ncbi:MAG: stalk-specific protein [Caulobacteraceae bacterium]|nr:stalk-specific protein [Caulobacteraceae bacterium]